MKQWPQGLWVVTPAGKVLGFHYHTPKPGESYAEGQTRWTRETLEMVRGAVKEIGPIAPSKNKPRPDPLADRGRGTGAAGGVRLAVTVTALRNGIRDGPPVVDHIPLNREQWAELNPPASGAAVGRTWGVTDAVARQFTPALSPLTDPIFSPTPGDATTARITATVKRVNGNVAVIEFSGRWETAHNRDGNPKYPIRTSATGDGVGVFDIPSGKMTSFVWVLQGTFRNSPPEDKPRTTAAVIEWSAGP